MVDRETLLWIVSGSMLARLIWIEVRPLVLRYFARHIIVAGQIECQSLSFKYKGEKFFCNQYYMPIVNTHPEGKTIKGVKGFLHTPFDLFTAKLLNEDHSVDLNSGQKTLIKIGEFISTDPFGLINKGESPPDKLMESHLINAPRGFYTFYCYGVGMGLTRPNEKKERATFSLIMQVVGENVKGTSKNALMSPNRGSGRHPASGFWHFVALEWLI